MTEISGNKGEIITMNKNVIIRGTSRIKSDKKTATY